MVRSPIAAVVLASGGGQEPVSRHFGLPHKALVPVGGVPTVRRVVEALLGAALVSQVVVVSGAPGVREAVPAEVPVVPPSGPSFLGTIATGLRHFPDTEQMLLCTSDLPLLTPTALDDFLRQALDSEAELCYSMVEAGCLAALPVSGGRMVVRLRDGRYSGGNLAYLTRRFVEQEGARLEAAFLGRKSLVRLGALLGPSFLWRLLWGQLAVADIQAKAEQLMGVPVAVVDSAFVEVCYDIDKPVHVRLAESILAQRSAG